MCKILVQDTSTDKGLRQNDDVTSKINIKFGNVSVWVVASTTLFQVRQATKGR